MSRDGLVWVCWSETVAPVITAARRSRSFRPVKDFQRRTLAAMHAAPAAAAASTASTAWALGGTSAAASAGCC